MAYPDRIAALVYIDAGYPYAFDNGKGPTMKDFQSSGSGAAKPSDEDLASFSALQKWDAKQRGFGMPEAEIRQSWESDSFGQPRKMRGFPGSPLFAAILTSTRRFTDIPVPALFVFAVPRTPGRFDAARERQAKVLERGVPTARVIRLPGEHHIFLSNASDTLREMRSFLGGLN